MFDASERTSSSYQMFEELMFAACFASLNSSLTSESFAESSTFLMMDKLRDLSGSSSTISRRTETRYRGAARLWFGNESLSS